MDRDILMSIPAALFGIIGVLGLALATGCQSTTGASAPLVVGQTALDHEPERMVEAFFGLDNALPPRARVLSRAAPGRDGWPGTFSRRIVGPIDPEVFTVVTKSGDRMHPMDATLRPADAPSKRHTVLLIGEFGDDPFDPPVRVEMTGSLKLEGGADAIGMEVDVTPLAAGPTIALAYMAEPVPGSAVYPKGTTQVLVVVWAGGVHPLPETTAEAHRLGYTVVTTGGVVKPIGVGDLGDNDNYEHLYLDSVDMPLRVEMAAGLLMDPRDDPNPVTEAAIAPLATP